MSRPPLNSVRVCPKCGDGLEEDATGAIRRPMRYYNDGSLVKTGAGKYAFTDPDEWIERTCTRCIYKWEEATLDVDPA